MDDFGGKVAVVAGASSGLGRRLALDMAERGAQVIGIARRQEPPVTHMCDVSDVDAYRALLGEIEQEHGRVDILVNAAGFERQTRIEDADFDLYREIFETNFFALVAGTLAVVPGMLERGSGVVVNISSDHGRAPAPGTPAYSASKAAVSAFTESVALEVADRGVRLHILYPGWVPTRLGQGVVEGGMPMPPKMVRRSEEQVSRTTLRKMGSAAVEINCARAATFAPVARALVPPIYRKQMKDQAVRPT